jgi:hypothetical protein
LIPQATHLLAACTPMCCKMESTAADNLLAGHRLTGVAYAQTVVTQALNDDFPNMPLDITWRLPWNFCGAVQALADHARGSNGHEPLIAQTLDRCAEELKNLEACGHP